LAKKIAKSNCQLRHVNLQVRVSLWDNENPTRRIFVKFRFYVIHIYIYIYFFLFNLNGVKPNERVVECSWGSLNERKGSVDKCGEVE
jgi:hypothetical protein